MAGTERNRSNPDDPPAAHRRRAVDGEHGPPAEFIDTPENQPGDHSPPNPADGNG